MTAPLLGIVGYSGTGKTTLLKKLIPLLCDSGYDVALIKHTHHNMDIDTPGKDSYELRKAGAHQTIIACENRWALMTETPAVSLDLMALAAKFEAPDLILVEGFKEEPIPKMALYRTGITQPPESLLDEHVIAVASNIALSTTLPQLDINNPALIARWIMDYFPRSR